MATREGELFHAPVELASEMLKKQTDFFLDQMRGTNRRPAMVNGIEEQALIQEIAALVPPTEGVTSD
jgi:hypothetical protein|tara:strand:+ start:489 stop:689 length:201 start_codon:yes stop_codon:yes gene_type:complete